MLEHLRSNGEFDVTDDGVMVYPLYGRNVPYPVLAAFHACAEMFDIARSRDPSCPDNTPLHTLVRVLETGEVDEVQVDMAVACLASLRAYAASQPVDALIDVAKTLEIKFRMDVLE